MDVVQLIHDAPVRDIQHLATVVADGIDAVARWLTDHFRDPLGAPVERVHFL